MNNLLQDCSPPGYVSADDKYLWLSYKPLFRKAQIEMLPGPFLRARRARAGVDVYSLSFIMVWGGVREWGDQVIPNLNIWIKIMNISQFFHAGKNSQVLTLSLASPG